MVWLIAEQDMGGDDFITVLLCADQAEKKTVYRLDLQSFKGLTDDLNSLQEIVIGGNINVLCEQLETEDAYLLLDDVCVLGSPSERRSIASGAEELARTFLDFCKSLKIIIRSSIAFSVPGVQPVVLQALDEPECNSYIELHPLSNNARKDEIKSGAIYSHTSGRPGRIDQLLTALTFDSFDSVALGSSDESIDFQATIPRSLQEEIEKLQLGNEHERTTYNLMIALTFFKYGECVKTIRYFGDCQRLKPGMANHLVSAGLAEPAETHELSIEQGAHDKFIVIKPAVQQYIHKLLGEEKLVDAYQEAASIYFGKDWKIGKPKIHSSFRLSTHRINSIIEQNAALILARLLSDALHSKEHNLKQKQIIDRILVFHSYLQRLMQTDKFLYSVRLCRALLPKLDDYDNHHFVKNIRLQFARALRMLGEYEEAITECQKLLIQENPAEIRASLYINMAYAYENSGDTDKAKEMAGHAKKIKRAGSSFFHAESILIGLSDDAHKFKRLDDLAEMARRKGSVKTSNTIKMDIIAELNDPREQLEEYRKLAERAQKDGDEFNMMRARIWWFELAIDLGFDIDPKHLDTLVSAYIYSCSQRQRRMFTQSHAALWVLLENSGQLESMLQLFRHSSTLQRLTGKIETELQYLKRLSNYIAQQGLEQVIRQVRMSALRYFAARADSHNLLTSQQLKLINNQE
ncbi:tetratricopeptide repeat protein [Pseudomonas sp. AL 58]|uniref:tetratricopeptide repeat protein n=1 Tax=Pseudomonas sp. AL 58 TaxID=3104275 RepID=UPI002EB5B70C|nr:tetratricopeptide repeat protein [Pseudomonas sp. AL 58]